MGLAVARCLPSAAIDRLQHLIGALGPQLPVVARIVEKNMRAIGLYTPQAQRDYFDNLAGHLAGAMQVWRFRDPGVTAALMPVRLAEQIHRRIELDESINVVREHVARGQGVVLVGPHLCGYLLYLARLNEVVPLSAYLRPARVKRRRALHERWMRTVGLRRLVDHESGSNPTLVMAGAVRDGGVVYLTPDLPRKRDEGEAVRFFDREIYLPAGLSLIARRAAAPMYFVSARIERGVCRLAVQGPYEPPPKSAGRSPAGQHAMQWFADQFQRLLSEQPGAWYFWADKRWTRVFRGDSRYTRMLAPQAIPTAAGAAAGS